MKADREHDAAIDRMLRASLRAPAAGGDACPEAGDLAAFVEGGLSESECQAIERHASACARCQQALALIGSVPPTARTTPSLGRWLLTAQLRWAIPAALAALAVVAYVALGPMSQPPPGPAETQTAAKAPARPQSQADRSLVAQNVPAPPPPPAATPAGTRTRAPKREASAEPPAARERAKLPDAGPSRPRLDAIEERSVAAPPGVAGRPEVVPQLPAQQGQTQQAPTPQARAQQVQAQRNAVQPISGGIAGGIAGGVVGGVVGGPPEAPPPPAKAAAGGQIAALAEKVQVGGAAPSTVATPVLTTFAAPDRSVLWRIDTAGEAFRSRDGGVTWTAWSNGGNAGLLAGSAPTSTVCWLVGRHGIVLLTVDGERWEQRPFPESIELVKIDARDTRNATVTARDGRRFVTTDGGMTWK